MYHYCFVYKMYGRMKRMENNLHRYTRRLFASISLKALNPIPELVRILKVCANATRTKVPLQIVLSFLLKFFKELCREGSLAVRNSHNFEPFSVFQTKRAISSRKTSFDQRLLIIQSSILPPKININIKASIFKRNFEAITNVMLLDGHDKNQ